MASYNRVILMGNLTRDPEVRHASGGSSVCNTGLAVNRTWTDGQGQRQESVCFVDLTLFGKQADTFAQYMHKGRPVLIEGRLDFQQWDDKDGGKRSRHVVIVERFQFLGGNEREKAFPREDATDAPAPGEDGIPF